MGSRISWFGIDFGTTNSAAFSFTGVNEKAMNPISYGDDEGRPFPSVVAIDKITGEVIAGREAKERRNELAETHHYISSIKTYLGTDKVWKIGDEYWTAEDVASEILAALTRSVSTKQNDTIDEAVFAVPVGYSIAKKQALRNAAERAGIKVKMFVSEPTAAFYSNYDSLKNCKNVAVFDWGGGTLDVVVITVEDDSIIELASDGMEFAGNDIDLKLAEKMHAKFTRKKNSTLTIDDLDARTKDQLLTKCEKAKCDFEDENYIAISINKYGDLGAVRDNMDYDFFKLLIENDIERAVGCLKSAIKKAGLNIQNIDRILCVGGSSKLRPLQERLEEIFGEDMILYPDRAMWDIARGAGIISVQSGEYTLSKPIGLELSDGSFFPLLEVGQTVPCKEVTTKFSVVDQTGTEINEARFIFTDSNSELDRDLYEYLTVPLRGFKDEYITLSYYVDQDNIFKLKITSNREPESCMKVWSYEGLKLSFHVGE